MKKALPILILLLLIAVPFASASFLDFFKDIFTGNAISGYDSIEGCKRYISMDVGATKLFNFDSNKYQITLNSIDNSLAHLTVNQKAYSLAIPSSRTKIDDQMALSLGSVSFRDTTEILTMTLNKEDEKCSCVSELATVKNNKETIVSDGVKDHKISIVNFYYDETTPSTSSFNYIIDSSETDKVFKGTTVIVWPLDGLKVKTEKIYQDGSVDLTLDNSINCKYLLEARTVQEIKQPETEKPAQPVINLGILKLQLHEAKTDSNSYIIEIPKAEQPSIIIKTASGSFDIFGNKVDEQKAAECPTEKTFWQYLGF